MKRGAFFDQDQDQPCEFCSRVPTDSIPNEFRPKCASDTCPPDLHKPVCCNGAFIARLAEFAECARQTRGMYLRSTTLGMNNAAKHLLRVKRALEMFEILTPSQLNDILTQGKPFYLVRRRDDRPGRFFESIRIERATKDGQFVQTFDGIDAPQCTMHMTERGYSDKHQYRSVRDAWIALENDTLTVRGEFIKLANGMISVCGTFADCRTEPPDMQVAEERTFIPCVLRPAKLKTLCMAAINEHRIPYEHADIPEPQQMMPLLWKASDPDKNRDILRLLDDMDCFGDVIRRYQKKAK